MTLFTDRVTGTLERALDGVAAQQRTTAQNIANASTPGYRAQRVSFQDALAEAVSSGADPGSAAITTSDAGTPAGVDGNTVTLDAEMTDLTRENLQYQAVSQAVSFKLSLLRTAIQGQ